MREPSPHHKCLAISPILRPTSDWTAKGIWPCRTFAPHPLQPRHQHAEARERRQCHRSCAPIGDAGVCPLGRWGEERWAGKKGEELLIGRLSKFCLDVILYQVLCLKEFALQVLVI